MRRYWRHLIAFFASRWRGEVALQRIFWNDMLLVGTLINLATTLLALFLFAADVEPVVAIAIFLAPLPYNFLLFIGVWMAAAHVRMLWAVASRTAAAMWITATVLI